MADQRWSDPGDKSSGSGRVPGHGQLHRNQGGSAFPSDHQAPPPPGQQPQRRTQRRRGGKDTNFLKSLRECTESIQRSHKQQAASPAKQQQNLKLKLTREALQRADNRTSGGSPGFHRFVPDPYKPEVPDFIPETP